MDAIWLRSDNMLKWVRCFCSDIAEYRKSSIEFIGLVRKED